MYVCNLCAAKCRQAHTLREHFRDIHKKDVELSTVKTLFTPEKIAQNPANGAKRVYEIFTCKCGTKVKSKCGFKRHVKGMYGSKKFDVFGKFKKMKKSSRQRKSRKIW